MLRELQTRMAEALLDPTVALPKDLAPTSNGVTLDRRFTVHRATVGQSLHGVLSAAFPLTGAILGPRRFVSLANTFSGQHPPSQAWLYAYGADFPAWLAEQPDGRRVAYLADMARIDWARHMAYFAGDAVRLDPAALGQLPPGTDPGSLVFIRHPAASVIVSRYAVASLAAALADRDPDDTSKIRLPEAGEALLVNRSEEGLVVDAPLTLDEGLVTQALFDGRSLGEALGLLEDSSDGFDLQALLAKLFTIGVFSAAAPAPLT